MKPISVQQIETQTHPETKKLFWYLFVGTKGGNTRVRIITQLRNKPSNKNQLAMDLDIDYKGIEHHLKTLEESNIVSKLGARYGVTYFVSPLFEEAEAVFDEIVTKLKKVGGPEWSK